MYRPWSIEEISITNMLLTTKIVREQKTTIGYFSTNSGYTTYQALAERQYFVM